DDAKAGIGDSAHVSHDIVVRHLAQEGRRRVVSPSPLLNRRQHEAQLVSHNAEAHLNLLSAIYRACGYGGRSVSYLAYGIGHSPAQPAARTPGHPQAVAIGGSPRSKRRDTIAATFGASALPR